MKFTTHNFLCGHGRRQCRLAESLTQIQQGEVGGKNLSSLSHNSNKPANKFQPNAVISRKLFLRPAEPPLQTPRKFQPNPTGGSWIKKFPNRTLGKRVVCASPAKLHGPSIIPSSSHNSSKKLN
ncbi:hypothetical protein HUJ05_010980 [Dendroctonus ponderosae]|nr:hypothetical protein HUJ05_010980 [Dendroctonus ponderosae]